MLQLQSLKQSKEMKWYYEWFNYEDDVCKFLDKLTDTGVDMVKVKISSPRPFTINVYYQWSSKIEKK